MIVDVFGKTGCPECDQVKAMLGKIGVIIREHELEYHLDGHNNWKRDGSVALAAYCNHVATASIPLPILRIDGVLYDPGEAFSRPVPLSHLVIDVGAPDIWQISYIGDRFKRPRSWVNKMKEGGCCTMAEMQPEPKVTGDKWDDDETALYDECYVWEIFLPKQNLIVLFEDGNSKPLYVGEWDGPEAGPYQILGFDWVPDNVMPSAPAHGLLPLHNFVNNLTTKLERQAERQKTIVAYDRGAERDAEQVRDAKDGHVVGVSDISKMREVNFGGADPSNHNMVMWADGEFDIHAGGLAVLGGTEPMSGTVGQDQLLSDSANVQIDSMRRSVMKFVKQIIRAHAWYIWTDPIREIHVVKKVPGTNIEIPAKITPEEREGDFLDYNFEINPYSMREVTPQERSQALMGLVNNVIGPYAEMAMQQGKTLNIVGIADEIAELQGIKTDLWIEADEEMIPTNQLAEQNAPRLRRFETVNTRVSRPSNTRASRLQNMQNANMKQMAGGNNNGKSY